MVIHHGNAWYNGNVRGNGGKAGAGKAGIERDRVARNGKFQAGGR